MSACNAHAHPLTLTLGDSCCCDLRELECFPSPSCLLGPEAAKRVGLGVALRQQMRQHGKWEGEEDAMTGAPPGKALQYSTIRTWKRWLNTGVLPRKWRSDPSPFIDTRHFPACQAHEPPLRGKPCLFRDFTEADAGSIERRAHRVGNSSAWREYASLERFRLAAPLSHQAELSPLLYALSYAHVLAMRYNPTPALIRAYHANVAHIDHTGAPASSPERFGPNQLRLSMHIRRSDACGHSLDRRKYAQEPSRIDSFGQVSGRRLCYATHVYATALRKVCRAYRVPMSGARRPAARGRGGHAPATAAGDDPRPRRPPSHPNPAHNPSAPRAVSGRAPAQSTSRATTPTRLCPR